MRIIPVFFYIFSYILFHPFALIKGLKALKAGDFATVDAITKKHVPIWCRGVLKTAGIKVTMTGQENIPMDRPCVFVANHRSLFDFFFLLLMPNGPMPLVAKIEIEKVPFIRQWMKLLHCMFIDREDAKQSLKILAEAQDLITKGYNVGIFPEGTRYKGEEGGMGTFLSGSFRVAVKTGAPVVPVVIYNSRAIMESKKHLGVYATDVEIHVLPPISSEGLPRSGTGAKTLAARAEELIREELKKK